MTKIKHQDYYDALHRLMENIPQKVKKYSKVNSRNVALEAGKDPSSIRKNRGMDDLIAAIEKSKSPNKGVSQKAINQAAKAKERQVQDMLDIAHAKYLAATYALFEAGLFNPYEPPTTVYPFPEKDNTVRPLIDHESDVE
jgi:hypothetical protein